MNMLHLKYAVEVEKAGSITQAADNLFMAQPNLSKAIKELEDTLDITIFERTSRGVIATPKGVEFLSHAKNVLGELEAMKSLRQDERTDIQAFSLSMPRGSYIAEGFSQFIAKLDPDKSMDVRIKETNSMQAIHNIVDGNFRLGIIRYHAVNEMYFIDYLKEKGLKHELVWTFENLALMSRDNPVAKKDSIDAGDLARQIEIVHGDEAVPYLTGPDAHLLKQATKPRKIYVYERSTQFDLLTRIPDTYIWVSPVPDAVLKRHQLVQRRCQTPRKEMKDMLIYPIHYKLTRLDKLFVDCLFAARNQVAFQEYT